jgi:hypothetical protein
MREYNIQIVYDESFAKFACLISQDVPSAYMLHYPVKETELGSHTGLVTWEQWSEGVCVKWH